MPNKSSLKFTQCVKNSVNLKWDCPFETTPICKNNILPSRLKVIHGLDHFHDVHGFCDHIDDVI